MSKRDTIVKVLKVSGAIARAIAGIGAAAFVFLGLLKGRRR